MFEGIGVTVPIAGLPKEDPFTVVGFIGALLMGMFPMGAVFCGAVVLNQDDGDPVLPEVAGVDACEISIPCGIGAAPVGTAPPEGMAPAPSAFGVDVIQLCTVLRAVAPASVSNSA